MKILSIDAWAGSCGECDACQAAKENKSTEGLSACWVWNNWFTVGELKSIPENDEAIVDLMIEEGYLRPQAKGLVTVEDDGYNIVIQNKETLEPIFAIEYGNEG